MIIPELGLGSMASGIDSFFYFLSHLLLVAVAQFLVKGMAGMGLRQYGNASTLVSETSKSQKDFEENLEPKANQRIYCLQPWTYRSALQLASSRSLKITGT